MGSEFELTTPNYSFNVNPASNAGQVSYSGNKIIRVGNTFVQYTILV